MLTFRRTRRGDLPQIQTWLRRPHVARYWAHDTSDAAVERDFAGSFLGTEPSEDFVVSDDGAPVGFIQRCRIHDYADEERELIALVDVPVDALTIDYFVGEPDRVGQGLGTRMIREFTATCWRDHPGATTIVVPVVTGNAASWGALRSAGFRWVATGWLPPDNPVDDGQHHVYRLDRPVG
ncbi:GNAT family N-acetyltransferase [Isoptericola hypogeus]|uniref:GNAT family N-acetyltransferase n=1 Tax=Isoptericola hypogeus TaxID=300179 RepID=A0ABN2J3A1_9MICO